MGCHYVSSVFLWDIAWPKNQAVEMSQRTMDFSREARFSLYLVFFCLKL